LALGCSLLIGKKDGGIRPIAIGYTIRRLAAKCANRHAIVRRSEQLKPLQVGVGVSGGAEAIVHTMRRSLDEESDEIVTVKLDFVNEFNSVRRDHLLDSIASNTPELYCFAFAKYSCEPKLVYGNHIILSREGNQQGDPLSSLEFCDALQPTLSSLKSDIRLGFMDDVTLHGKVDVVAADVETINAASGVTGLVLNPLKCEIIANNFDSVPSLAVFNEFKRVNTRDMTLLGVPVQRGPAVELALRTKLEDLNRAMSRLTMLHSHDALVLLKNSLSLPKLLYTLRTSECCDSPVLPQIYAALRDGLSIEY